ncbi:DUF3247 family protein [Lysobacter sp. K5869]|uniref:DUF3247 family protein n=1 Tax=Lysobacter sp. K5869 TaxID=2820808 RepID=UPI001C0608CF|nr:DUF3247 family protein [Lysobacter sp. K5869]QWP75472.1 DUF3247 family protein [Lysobacter sp. K5869]
MTQLADRVYRDAAEIERLTALVAGLPDEGLVDLQLIDGSWRAAVVTTRPSLQTFLDPEGNEGVNAVVRIDDPTTGRSDYLWIDEIARIRPVHSAERKFTD